MISNNHSFALPAATLPVCLLVPQDLFPLLMCRLKREKCSTRFYLSRIIQLAQHRSVTLPFASRVNTLYQRTGLGLTRLTVRLPLALWAQFRSLARSRGVSVCYLFTLLMEQDNKNNKSVETSTLKQLQFREILDLVRKTLYRELKTWPNYILRL